MSSLSPRPSPGACVPIPLDPDESGSGSENNTLFRDLAKIDPFRYNESDLQTIDDVDAHR